MLSQFAIANVHAYTQIDKQPLLCSNVPMPADLPVNSGTYYRGLRHKRDAILAHTNST
jgi:hypothetical protein